MRYLVLLGVLLGCTERNATIDNPLVADDAHDLPTAAACERDDQCGGGTCLGVPGSLEDGNPRFAGGYCTTTGCVADSQEGCGPDEWCVDFGSETTYCLAMCSKEFSCARDDHVCIGLGVWGGCMSARTVECDSSANVGCGDDELCVRIGFDDGSLGRCETLCEPFAEDVCGVNACYYIRRYNAAFCGTPGTTPPEEVCTCDKCCVEGYTCAPDPDGAGKHCKPACLVADGCGNGMCVPLEDVSPYGGCFLPGSPGT